MGKSNRSNRNAQIIKNTIDIDDDCALGAADILARQGVGELVSARLLDDLDLTIEAVDADGATYILEFNQKGYLQVVQADSLDGPILFAVVQ